MTNLFENKPIRSVWDKTNNMRWFSVVDVVAALTNSDYAAGRNYWKWLKHKLRAQKFEAVSVTNQLKMQAADGKLRFTDVMSCAEIMQLIQVCPSPKAEAFKLWIADMAASGKNILKNIEKAIKNAKDMIRSRVGNVFLTIETYEFDIFGDGSDFPENSTQHMKAGPCLP